MGCQRGLDQYLHALASAGGPPVQILMDSSAIKTHRCASGGKYGEQYQAIGRSRGGRTTKIHAQTGELRRPVAFLLTGGHVADCSAADTLLERMPPATIVNGDKGYDSNALRQKIKSLGAVAKIPPKINRRQIRFSPVFTGAATPSSGCSRASRTPAGLQPDMTNSPPTSSPPSPLSLSSATGYESGP